MEITVKERIEELLEKYYEDNPDLVEKTEGIFLFGHKFINEAIVKEKYIRKDKVKSIQIIDIDGHIHNVHKVDIC